MSKLVFKSPRVPQEVWENEEFMTQFMTVVDTQHTQDSPSPSDLRRIFAVYSECSPAGRELVDQAFIWFAGYTLASLAAMAEHRRDGKSGEKYEELVQEWRKHGRKAVRP